MHHVKRRGLAGLILVTVFAACADPADRITAPGAEPADLLAPDSKSPVVTERAALEKLGRLIAVSLGERKMRHKLKKHLRAAPFKEHKLELSAYLRSADGQELLTKLSGGEKKSDAVLTLLGQIRPLELYMPVRKHRETWIGDGELLVAVQLEEEDPIVAFDGRGKSRHLDAAAPPEQPTISIVPVETRFDQPMPVGSRNVNDLNGAAIGTLEAPQVKTSSIGCAACLDDDPGGVGAGEGAGPGIVPPGLYLEFSRIVDAMEPWIKSEPEIEVHIHGPSTLNNPRVGDDLSCSGARVFDNRKYFDQNDGFWNGRVMLFSQEETARFNALFGDGFHVMFWEDDDTPCVLKLDNDVLMELLKSTATFGAVALKIVPWNWGVAASGFIAAFFSNPGAWLKTNDDFVGVAVPQEQGPFHAPANTHVIMNGKSLNGRANIVFHQ
ncbi:MAG TPA: hypothetical protein VNO75_11555 [Gemmatimonadaceae bacterium]|nr:hypothetical protein [Gemmatimonadaceae bacterium]